MFLEHKMQIHVPVMYQIAYFHHISKIKLQQAVL